MSLLKRFVHHWDYLLGGTSFIVVVCVLMEVFLPRW